MKLILEKLPEKVIELVNEDKFSRRTSPHDVHQVSSCNRSGRRLPCRRRLALEGCWRPVDWRRGQRRTLFHRQPRVLRPSYLPPSPASGPCKSRENCQSVIHAPARAVTHTARVTRSGFPCTSPVLSNLSVYRPCCSALSVSLGSVLSQHPHRRTPMPSAKCLVASSGSSPQVDAAAAGRRGPFWGRRL